MVDSYGNLNFLDLRNVPNAKTYSVFEKIMDIFILGGVIIEKKALQNDGTINDDIYRNVTSPISVIGDQQIKIEISSTGGSYPLCEYAYDQSFIKYNLMWNASGTDTLTLANNTRYIRLNVETSRSITISYVATGETIFSYQP